MKKRINLTLDETDYNFLKSQSVNISAWVRAIISWKRTHTCININNEIPQEIKEVVKSE